MSTHIEPLRIILKELDLFIEVNDANSVEPLILKTTMKNDDHGNSEFRVTYIRQLDRYIENVQPPYRMEQVIVIPHCLYFRYEGFGVELFSSLIKVQTDAQESGICLSNDIYTLLISDEVDDNTIITEIFIPIID